MKIERKIIEIDEEKCTGCGQCVTACAEGAIQLVNGKARLVAETYCDGLAACLGECPEGALQIVERRADAFDPEAVEEHLKKQAGHSPSGVGHSASAASLTPDPSDVAGSRMQGQSTLECGCPSTHVKIFSSPCDAANEPKALQEQSSALSHWPVQIRLVPPTAPFLKGADLLVASDCTPVAYPDFHRDLLRGKAVMMGCPKFDDTEEYVRKFAAVFQTAGIKSVTVAIMEVPCCSKMPAIVREAMNRAGKQIPMEIVVVSGAGKVLRRQALAA